MNSLKALVLFILVIATAPITKAFEIQEVTSPNGVKAWLVEEHAIPILSLSFSFDGAMALEDRGKQGTSAMLASILDEGAGDMNSQQFKAAILKAASSIHYSATSDSMSGYLNTLTDNRSEAARLLKLTLLQPAFKSDELNRVKTNALRSLQQSNVDPTSIAFYTWAEKAFPTHIYGANATGTEASVAAITADDLRALKAKIFNRSTLKVVAVGDIDAETLGKILDDVFSELPNTPVTIPTKNVEVAKGPIDITIPFDNPQTVINFGFPGINGDTRESWAASLLAEALGGGANFSRLNQEIREKNGLTYSVGMYSQNYPYAAFLFGSMSTANATAKQALQKLRGTLNDVAANGINAEELRKVKSYKKGSFPLRFTDNASIASELLSAYTSGEKASYIADYASKIDAVTLDDIKKVAATLLRPENLIVVQVGKPE
jgi:zinc protease